VSGLDLAQRWVLARAHERSERLLWVGQLFLTAAILCDLAFAGAVEVEAGYPVPNGFAPFADGPHVSALEGLRDAQVARPQAWLPDLAGRLGDVVPGIAQDLRRRDLLPPPHTPVERTRWPAVARAKDELRAALVTERADRPTATLVWMLSLVQLAEPEDGIARLARNRRESRRLRRGLHRWVRHYEWPFATADTESEVVRAILVALGDWIRANALECRSAFGK
jgi:hypothetical protein